MSVPAPVVNHSVSGFEQIVDREVISSLWSVKVWALITTIVVLGIHWGSTLASGEPKPKSASLLQFPLVGSKIGGEYQRREHFMTHAWDLFREGSRMVSLDKITLSVCSSLGLTKWAAVQGSNLARDD